ncbi:MAG: M12 family metallo-peptidase [Bacteroidota bacterium]
MSKFYLAFALAICTLSVSAQSSFQAQPTAYEPNPGSLAELEHYDLVSIDHAAFRDLWAQPFDRFEITLEGLSEAIMPFTLDRIDLRASDYQMVIGSDGQLVRQKLPSAQFLGQLILPAGGKSILTISETFLMMYWQLEDREYFLDPLWRYDPEAPRDVYVLYTSDEVIAPELGCGNDHNHDHDHDEGGGAPPREAQRMMGCVDFEIALAADFELFQDFNNNPVEVENFMLNNLALVQTLYDDEFGEEINFFVTAIYIATSNATDPWTSSTSASDLLGDFRNWGNDGNFCNNFDVATLWTGRNFDGNTIGIAFTPGACSTARYNTVENFSANTTLLRNLLAHELGHNLSAVHVGGFFIMAASINASSAWSNNSVNSINSFVANNQDCFSTCPTSAPPTAAAARFTQVCAGSKIGFFDETIDGAHAYEWQFPGGNPSSSTERNPIVEFNSIGNFTATLTVSNSAGSANAQVPINVTTLSNDRILFYENFEKGFGEITVVNSDNEFGWVRAGVPGNQGQICAFMNNYDYNQPGEEDIMRLPTVDLNGLSTPVLEVEYAYAPFDSDLFDVFHIDVTGDNGSPQRIFTSDANFPTRPAQTTRFIPETENDWCEIQNKCLEIDLSAFDGQSVTIDLVNENGFGNYFFIDNVVVRASCDLSLPVEWLSFRAVAVDKTAVLDWSVIQDDLHAGFQVQRANLSVDNNRVDWQDIGWVDASGPTNQTVEYDYRDENVIPGQTYLYRLRQEDIDGTTSFSEIREVSFEASQQIEIWPNPVLDVVELLTPFEQGSYELLDQLGRTLLMGEFETRRTSVDLSGLASGVYWLRIGNTSAQPELIKLVKR